MTSRVLTPDEINIIGNKIAKEWADKGKLIEGGWQIYLAFGLQSASHIQRTEMRKAYFLGAQHLFASIMSIMDKGSEPTEKDLERMTLISNELEDFKKSILNSIMN
jgi:hypothetical protein